MELSATKAGEDARVSRTSLSLYHRFLKRGIDVILALALLPIVLPVILVFWVAIRLDGGPGFYVQPRVGRDGRRFDFIKLRSMLVDGEKRLEEAMAIDPHLAAEWREMQKLKEDPRITPLGSFLRKSSIDELPQIFNVLRGDMSLVGPRPFTADQEDMYRQGGGRSYFEMRPGITGLWQVSGRSQTTFVERVNFDDAYFRDCSFRLDLEILLRTVTVVLKGTGT